MLPSLFFRGSSTALHVPPSTDHLPNTEHAFNGMDPEGQSEEERSQREEKLEEADRVV